MKRKPSLGPRNPLVALSLFRKAGVHRKSAKAQRARDKHDTRCLAQSAAQGTFNLKVAGSSPAAPTTSDAVCSVSAWGQSKQTSCRNWGLAKRLEPRLNHTAVASR